MERIQNEWKHEYLVNPTTYQMSDNNNHSTYDQFIQLRDTLVFTWKKYSGKAWLKLAVWDKEETIEVVEREYFRQSFEPWYESDSTKITTQLLWKTISKWTTVEWIAYPELTCTINKDGRYLILHKEQLYKLNNTVSKIHCYVLHHERDATTKQYKPDPIVRAVFDWEWSWTLSWTTSWTQPNWTCTVNFTLWQLFQKVTSFGIIEVNLKKWDFLEMKMDIQWDAHLDSTSFVQPYSNRWSVEYKDLPYK